jgi:anti-sigma factor RsiW
VSAVCAILRGSLEEYLREELPAPQRNILREHLGGCVECRAAAAEKDPTLLFARPMPEAVDAEETAGILSAVRTGVSLLEAERRIGRGRGRFAGVAGAAAVALLVLTIPGGSTHPATGIAALPAPAPSAPAAASMARTPVAAAAGELAPVMLPGTVETAAPTSGATMYDLNPGAGRTEPRVVWIVDGGLDI